MIYFCRRLLVVVAALSVSPAIGFAQDQQDDQQDAQTAQPSDVQPEGAEEDVTPPQEPARDLPPSRSDSDPLPPVARPDVPAGGVVRQAGIGGSVGYGRAGVLELGGSAGFAATSNFNSLQINPLIGWFFADNVQLSAILGFSYFSTEGERGAADQDATMFSFLFEPSYHLPFSRSLFGFLGFGFGGAHVSDVGFGFAMAPRLGVNFLVGRSGILTPSLSFQYSTHDTMETMDGRSFATASTVLVANIGYTVMW